MALRLIVRTDGLWKVIQVSEAMSSLDTMCARIGAAIMISTYLESKSYVLANLRALGLLGRSEEEWGKPGSPIQEDTRREFLDLVRFSQGNGIETRLKHGTVGFHITTKDLADIIPLSQRMEVESLSMASPGEWVLILSGILAAAPVAHLLKRLIDALWKTPTERAKERKLSAEARLLEIQAEQAEKRKNKEEVGQPKDKSLQLQRSALTALDTVVASLRNAGFEESDIQEKVLNPQIKDSDIISRHRSSGMIISVSLEMVDSNGARRLRKKDGDRG